MIRLVITFGLMYTDFKIWLHVALLVVNCLLPELPAGLDRIDAI